MYFRSLEKGGCGKIYCLEDLCLKRVWMLKEPLSKCGEGSYVKFPSITDSEFFMMFW